MKRAVLCVVPRIYLQILHIVHTGTWLRYHVCRIIEEPHLFRFLFQSDYFNGKTLLELIDAEELIPVLSAMQRSLGIGMEQTKMVFIKHRHVEFFKNADGVRAHMKKHAAILKPKFDIVLDRLNKELTGLGIASWFSPKGGYFISLDVLPGTAKRVGELCKAGGVTLTSVGATYPYGIDPQDSNIRIAPSFPPNEEMALAAELLCICTRLAAIEKLVG